MARETRAGGYSGTPLAKKLGVKPGHVVRLVDAPAGFERLLPDLPPGARFSRTARNRDLTLWFPKDAADLRRRAGAIASALGEGGLWICWRKGQTAPGTLREDDVRDAGLGVGLVDYKVAAVDAVWSGLKFARRRT
ncbi:MAG TPA: DUF3052 domain-containing protein [Dehalococcoidia bacterium]|nr:DUF3052 domain-containing protein [Dehalococcoidia bacterium]